MRFAPLFQDHAVLQRNQSIPVWGLAGSEELVTVSLANQSARVKSDADGHWMVRFPALPEGGPHVLKATSPSGEVIANDILIGDVWICSGQSNMEWKLSQVPAGDPQGPLTDQRKIRLLNVTNPARLGHRQESIEGNWTLGTPQALLNFSAVGAWFGRELHRELGVPIGLICTAWGGTRIQAWTAREALLQDPAGRNDVLTYESALFQPPATATETYADYADWERRGAPQDSGNWGLKKGWASTDLDHTCWPSMSLPGRWQDNGHSGSGVLWFRHTLSIPSDWAGRDLKLHLGQIDKHDDTWVNSVHVGATSWEAGPNSWCTPRVYTVPSHLIGPDRRLVIAVRARSHVFHGGLIGPTNEMYVIPSGAPKDTSISLVGVWNFAVEQDWGIVQIPTANWDSGNPNSPYILFDSRVTPLIPYAINGVIWYQGESNASEAQVYKRLLPIMIRDWRRAWGQGNFAFLQVQLANFQSPVDKPEPSDWAELREAQAAALTEPNTGLAVAIDVGDALDIHPPDKKSVGLRLARWALTKIHGRSGTPSGPLYASASFEAGGKARIHFHHAAGLRTRDGKPVRHIAICGRDQVFVWAESKIENETLLVWHPEITQPTAVRYAWAQNPEGCNLVNTEGLPAAPFRTDD